MEMQMFCKLTFYIRELLLWKTNVLRLEKECHSFPSEMQGSGGEE